MSEGAIAGSQDALYLYAIVPNPGPDMATMDFGPGIALIEGTQFAAVVGPAADIPAVRRDRAQLARMLLAHQQLVERIMPSLPVLPVEFATIAANRGRIEHCLENGAAVFAKSFAALRGKTQFEILVTWNLEAVFAQIALDPKVVDFKKALPAAPNGVPSEEAGLQLGMLVKRIFEQRRADLGQRLRQELQKVAVDAVENALMDDSMVLNLAVLIDAEAGDALDACLETLDAAHDGRLNFRCVGPLPPHSFATVEVSFLEDGEIARAREVLALETVGDAEMLRDAYRRRAKQIHPDGVAGGAGGQDIGALKHAYETLSSYVEAGGPVVVAVRRQEPPATPGPA